jgi:hypothetical protein
VPLSADDGATCHSSKARGGHVFGAYSGARTNTPKSELDVDLDATSCTSEQRTDLKREQEQAHAELTEYLNDQKTQNPRDYLQSMKKELGEGETSKALKEAEEADEVKKKGSEPSLLRRAGTVIGNAVWCDGGDGEHGVVGPEEVGRLGFRLCEVDGASSTHDQDIVIEIKNRLCREVSEWRRWCTGGCVHAVFEAVQVRITANILAVSN